MNKGHGKLLWHRMLLTLYGDGVRLSVPYTLQPVWASLARSDPNYLKRRLHYAIREQLYKCGLDPGPGQPCTEIQLWVSINDKTTWASYYIKSLPEAGRQEYSNYNQRRQTQAL